MRWGGILLFSLLLATPCVWGQTSAVTPPVLNQGNLPNMNDLFEVVDKATAPDSSGRDWSTPVKLVIIFAGLAVLPSLVAMMTSFTRIVIVLAFVRRALSTQSIPPTVAMMGLALFLTLFTMAPTFERINTVAIEPYLNNDIDFGVAGLRASEVMKDFMLRQCRESDLILFVQMSRIKAPKTAQELGLHIVVPAFIISEFRTGFEIGCLLFIPFLVIDMVIAGILLSAGMMMLPPVMISLPFKLILFILVDGWSMLARSLTAGYLS